MVGDYVGQISGGEGTLFLEPAGVIPFYAKMRTYDYRSLGTNKVLDYWQRYGRNAWWIEFVKREEPNIIVSRTNILAGSVEVGGPLSAAQVAWLREHYGLARRFNYQQYLTVRFKAHVPRIYRA